MTYGTLFLMPNTNHISHFLLFLQTNILMYASYKPWQNKNTITRVHLGFSMKNFKGSFLTKFINLVIYVHKFFFQNFSLNSTKSSKTIYNFNIEQNNFSKLIIIDIDSLLKPYIKLIHVYHKSKESSKNNKIIKTSSFLNS